MGGASLSIIKTIHIKLTFCLLFFQKYIYIMNNNINVRKINYFSKKALGEENLNKAKSFNDIICYYYSIISQICS